jgi:hypothetical protein
LDNSLLRRIFGVWWVSFDESRRFSDLLAFGIEEFELGILNRFFERWKSVYTSTRYSRKKIRTIRARLELSIVRRAFSNWFGEFHSRKDIHVSLEKARLFRRLALQMKAFQSIKQFVILEQSRSARLSACHHAYLKRFCRSLFIRWKNRFGQCHRHTFLVRFILKHWAKALKLKTFHRWQSFVRFRRMKHEQYLSAKQIYSQRQIIGVLRGFVQGAPLHCDNHQTFSHSFREHTFSPRLRIPSSQSIHPSVIVDLPASPKSGPDHSFLSIDSPPRSPLTRPKRPAFLAIPQHPPASLKDVETRLQNHIRTMNTRSASADDRAVLLSLVREANELRRAKLNSDDD